MFSRIFPLLVSILLVMVPQRAHATALPRYDHVVLVIEENHSYAQIVGSSAAPFINKTLIPISATAGNYHAITHSSLPNYLGLIDGRNYRTSHNITNDCSPAASCQATGPTIADTLTTAGKPWRYYGESMPANCTKTGSAPYAVRHNPFTYYAPGTVTSDQCPTDDLPFTAFSSDLTASHLSSLVVVVPNTCHDMHDKCTSTNTVSVADSWLQSNVYTPLVASKTWTNGSHVLFIVVWDEGTGGSAGENCLATTDKSCQVAAILHANDGTTKSGVKLGAWGGIDNYSHLSLLATIEDVLGIARTPSVASTPAMADAFH
ncbi:MAG: alkaline phosphatase family protein [Chloroflexota bacterium]